jgi:hypothetical protein
MFDVSCRAEGGCEDFFAVWTPDAGAPAALRWLVIATIYLDRQRRTSAPIGSSIASPSRSGMSSLLDALFFAAVCLLRSACYIATKGWTHSVTLAHTLVLHASQHGSVLRRIVDSAVILLRSMLSWRCRLITGEDTIREQWQSQS